MGKKTSFINLVWKPRVGSIATLSLLDVDPWCLTDLRTLRWLLHKNGFTAKYVHIHDAWEEYSNGEYCASWLSTDYPEDRMLAALLRYLEVDISIG